MKRAEVTALAVVQIKITGHDQSQPGDQLPRVRDDKGLVRDLQTWCYEQGIYAVHTPAVGGGQMMAYYEPEDAEKVLTWLEDHNVVRQ
jgi:hypothetical protein